MKYIKSTIIIFYNGKNNHKKKLRKCFFGKGVKNIKKTLGKGGKNIQKTLGKGVKKWYNIIG